MSDIFSRMQHKYVKTIFKTWDVREICDIGQLIRLDSEGNSENFLSWQMLIEKLEFWFSNQKFHKGGRCNCNKLIVA